MASPGGGGELEEQNLGGERAWNCLQKGAGFSFSGGELQCHCFMLVVVSGAPGASYL